ncbi:hypothetical protein QJQ45_022979 [Haematococcus lacustris]|nr:hypothetical protein QJQ45_022979 [Haematococcus lacustris]
MSPPGPRRRAALARANAIRAKLLSSGSGRGGSLNCAGNEADDMTCQAPSIKTSSSKCREIMLRTHRVTCPVGGRATLKINAVARPLQQTRGLTTSTRVATFVDAVTSTSSERFSRKADGTYDLSAPPPFTLQDLRNAIPGNRRPNAQLLSRAQALCGAVPVAHCWEKNTFRSLSYLALDVAIVAGLAAVAMAVNQWWLWPIYYFAQGTMFWALFVIGHDCGHQSFSSNKALNDFIGNIVHSSILVPYHGWRISHREHHSNHGHVENDESWHPVTKSLYDDMHPMARVGRLSLPWSLFAFPFYLWQRSPGKTGSHYDPKCDLFTPAEGKQIMTSNAFLIGMLGVLAAATYTLGPLAIFNLYVIPYWINVVWLDVVTYLHHHGSSDPTEKMPWYRGEEWSFLRGGLTTIDRDFGIFNKIHHDIGTHVVHHLFSQIPHYNLTEATEAVKPVMGPFYREPQPSPGWFPSHLIGPLVRSFSTDHYVADTGNVVFYESDPALAGGVSSSARASNVVLMKWSHEGSGSGVQTLQRVE